MINEDKIRAEYEEHNKEFIKSLNEVRSSLEKIISKFFKETKFQAKIDNPRIKSLESCLNKVRKKNIDCESLVETLDGKLKIITNDFFGFRILCNTLDDVYQIAKMLEANKRFTKIKEDDYNDKPKESGYRALHIDFEYENYWTNDETIKIPIEVQIKTHLQHAWSEITHDESYKPSGDTSTNEWEKKYSKHMADLLDQLDSMARTIRNQRVTFIQPPRNLDSETIINARTLSYKIGALQKEDLTQQEMAICLSKLRELNFENLGEVNELLGDQNVEREIKSYKEKLKDNTNVKSFEILYYGAILKRKGPGAFKDVLKKDYGYIEERCEKCDALLTKVDKSFILEKTDGDILFCSDHRDDYYSFECLRCGLRTTQELCINCAAMLDQF